MKHEIWLSFCFANLINLTAVPLFAADSSAPPTQLRNTVDAFAGHWILTGTEFEPNASMPAAVKAIIDCKPASLDMAAICTISAEVGDAYIEAAAVVGYNPDEGVVRWMEISSTGEYHDHHGSWSGHEIRFEPLIYTTGGIKLAETFVIGFPSPDRMIFQAITQMPRGKSDLKVTGTRSHGKVKS